MGIFNKLFGKKKEKTSNESDNQELRMEYNIMKNISFKKCKKYENPNFYELIENGIYKDLIDEDDTKYRMTISYELESDYTNNQYPLEDILDKYYLFVSDFLESENDNKPNEFKLELGGDLNNLKKAKEIIGKKIFNSDFLSEGKIRVKLMIE